jgi:ABC-type antimicrobial peptide transport system permease subunit
MATSDQPILPDLNTPEGRLELGFSDKLNQQLEAWRAYSLRVAAGEDASCLNLYRPTQPRVLGVPNAFVERGRFDWAAWEKSLAASHKGAERIKYRVPSTEQSGLADQAPAQHAVTASSRAENPWTLLGVSLGRDEAGQPIVPVILDASTATYSLHLKGIGSRLTIRDDADRPVTLQVVGLLKNSILQGNLLVSEANFLRLFPDNGGYRFFLIEQSSRNTPRAAAETRQSDADAPGGRADGTSQIGRGGQNVPVTTADGTRSVPATLDADQVAALLESTLADDGFDAVDAREQLAQFLAVQNTYLSTFQSLGALGLLLGTIGLAVVQLRSVLERRGELALMRAAGFRRGRLVHMVLWENCLILIGGLAVGCVAAAVALVPQWLPREASVPWRELAMLLGIIAVVGLAAGWLATRSALRAPIVPALRGD